MDELWDIIRLSQYLGVKRSTLYTMIERKEIPHYRFGKLARFKPAEVEEWLLTKKCHCELKKETKRTPKRQRASVVSPIRIVQTAIDELNPGRYNRSGKLDRIKGLGKEE